MLLHRLWPALTSVLAENSWRRYSRYYHMENDLEKCLRWSSGGYSRSEDTLNITTSFGPSLRHSWGKRSLIRMAVDEVGWHVHWSLSQWDPERKFFRTNENGSHTEIRSLYESVQICIDLYEWAGVVKGQTSATEIWVKKSSYRSRCDHRNH